MRKIAAINSKFIFSAGVKDFLFKWIISFAQQDIYE